MNTPMELTIVVPVKNGETVRPGLLASLEGYCWLMAQGISHDPV